MDLMKSNTDIHCLHLTDQAVKASEKSKIYDDLFVVDLKQRYRISCQAALWRKDVLLSYLKSYESAWDFEEFGSKRAAIAKHNFYAIDDKKVKLNKYEIIPYVFTGIIQGRWYEEVIPLFEENNITVDFSKRGFVNDRPKRKLKEKIKKRIKEIA